MTVDHDQGDLKKRAEGSDQLSQEGSQMSIIADKTLLLPSNHTQCPCILKTYSIKKMKLVD